MWEKAGEVLVVALALGGNVRTMFAALPTGDCGGRWACDEPAHQPRCVGRVLVRLQLKQAAVLAVGRRSAHLNAHTGQRFCPAGCTGIPANGMASRQPVVDDRPPCSAALLLLFTFSQQERLAWCLDPHIVCR